MSRNKSPVEVANEVIMELNRFQLGGNGPCGNCPSCVRRRLLDMIRDEIHDELQNNQSIPPTQEDMDVINALIDDDV
jgi:hypothetical protein